MTKGTEITQDVIKRLQAISKAEGYLTDLGASVYRGSTDQILNESTQFPAALVRTSADSVEASRSGKSKRVRAVTVEAYAYDEGDYEPLLDDMAYDIRRALDPVTIENQISRNEMETKVGDFEYDHPKPGERYAVISTELSLTYVESYS